MRRVESRVLTVTPREGFEGVATKGSVPSKVTKGHSCTLPGRLLW